MFAALQQNWKSGVTVALVSVPLSIALAIASGATPLMGIITAVWAGLIAAIFGGSKHNIIGPAGALSGILTAFVLVNGVESLPLLAIISGVLMLLVFVLRWDKYLVFIPSSVMHGFTLGVALTIAATQLQYIFGVQLEAQHSLLHSVWNVLLHITQAHVPTLITFGISLLILFSIVRFIPRVPPVIVVAIVGCILGYVTEHGMVPFTLLTLLGKYGHITASVFMWPQFSSSMLTSSLFATAITVTIVAVLETLLSAKIAENTTKVPFNQSKEVLGVALANIGAGLAGGFPATGVFVRTALNIKSGANSKVSSAINAVTVAIVTLVLFSWFQYIPLAVVASILIFAAIRMVEIRHFRALYTHDKRSFILALVVALITVAHDALFGIVLGSAVALLLFVKEVSRGEGELTLHKDMKMIERIQCSKLSQKTCKNPDAIVYRFAGELSYFNMGAHCASIKKLDAPVIIISLRNLFYIDHDAIEMLESMLHEKQAAGARIALSGGTEDCRANLLSNKWFKTLEKNGLVFSSTSEALRSLGCGC